MRDTSVGGLLQRWVKREHIQYLGRTAQSHATQRHAEPTPSNPHAINACHDLTHTAHTEPAHAHTAMTPFLRNCATSQPAHRIRECAPEWYASAGRASRTSRKRPTCRPLAVFLGLRCGPSFQGRR